MKYEEYGMQSARIFGPNDMRLVETTLAKFTSYQVLCKVVRAGIYGTELCNLFR
jgi:hypothetical protein